MTAVYPFVEIVLQRKTMHTWVAEGIENARTQKQVLETEIRDIEQQIEQQTGDTVVLRNELDGKKITLSAQESAEEWFLWAEPYVSKWAPTTPFSTLIVVLIWLLVTSLLKGVCLVLQVTFVARVANRTVMDMRRIFYRKALELDQRRIDYMGTSNLMTQLSHNMILVSGGLTNFYGKCMREPMKMVACLIGAALISWQLLLISLFVVPFGAYVIHSVARRMKKAAEREMHGMTAVFQTLIESFGAIKTVRMFNRERTERKRFKDNAKSLYRMALKMSLYDSLLRPITEILGIVSIAVSILAGAYLVLNNETTIFGIRICDKPMSTSTLMMFYALLAGASDPARKMSEIFNYLVRGNTACKVLYQTFDTEPTITAPKEPQIIPTHKSNIAFQNVWFAYDANQPVIKGINLEIPFGQTLAIVGGNGSGKSTIISLLARFYDPHLGKVMIDGVDIKNANPRQLRRQMAWVTQEAELFRGTIWDNIKYGNCSASDEDIRHAAELAMVSEFLPRLTGGFHYDVGDAGKLLSAGQRQRVSLARAIVADPRILILDEATSQMDGESEQLIHKSLLEFLTNRTAIVITHRKSSLELADRVVVLDSGNIVSDSNDEDALENSVVFKKLFKGAAA